MVCAAQLASGGIFWGSVRGGKCPKESPGGRNAPNHYAGDHKCLRVAVRIYATMVNTQTDRHRERETHTDSF